MLLAVSKEERPDIIAGIVSQMVNDCSTDMTETERMSLVAIVVRAVQELPQGESGS